MRFDGAYPRNGLAPEPQNGLHAELHGDCSLTGGGGVFSLLRILTSVFIPPNPPNPSNPSNPSKPTNSNGVFSTTGAVCHLHPGAPGNGKVTVRTKFLGVDNCSQQFFWFVIWLLYIVRVYFFDLNRYCSSLFKYVAMGHGLRVILQLYFLSEDSIERLFDLICQGQHVLTGRKQVSLLPHVFIPVLSF